MQKLWKVEKVVHMMKKARIALGVAVYVVGIWAMVNLLGWMSAVHFNEAFHWFIPTLGLLGYLAALIAASFVVTMVSGYVAGLYK